MPTSAVGACILHRRVAQLLFGATSVVIRPDDLSSILPDAKRLILGANGALLADIPAFRAMKVPEK